MVCPSKSIQLVGMDAKGLFTLVAGDLAVVLLPLVPLSLPALQLLIQTFATKEGFAPRTQFLEPGLWQAKL